MEQKIEILKVYSPKQGACFQIFKKVNGRTALVGSFNSEPLAHKALKNICEEFGIQNVTVIGEWSGKGLEE